MIGFFGRGSFPFSTVSYPPLSSRNGHPIRHGNPAQWFTRLDLDRAMFAPNENGPLGLPSLHFGPPHNHGSPGPRGSFRSTHRSKKVRMAPPAVCARLRAPSGWHDDHRATCRGSRLNARKSPPPPAKPTYPFPSRKPAKKSNTPSPCPRDGNRSWWLQRPADHNAAHASRSPSRHAKSARGPGHDAARKASRRGSTIPHPRNRNT